MADRPEMTFSGGRGSAVLSLEREPIPLAALKVGQRVLVPSLFGYFMASVTEIYTVTDKGEGLMDAYAETPGLLFPLWMKDGHWWCDSSVAKTALKLYAGETIGRVH